jgi:hypothetical protein
MCLFEPSSAEDAKQLNDEAKLPYSRVVEALDRTPKIILVSGRATIAEALLLPFNVDS